MFGRKIKVGDEFYHNSYDNPFDKNMVRYAKVLSIERGRMSNTLYINFCEYENGSRYKGEAYSIDRFKVIFPYQRG